MKSRLSPPRLSTAFSENGKSAKKRLAEILDTKAKRLGAAAIVLALLTALTAGAFFAFAPKHSPTPEAEISLAERLFACKHAYIGDASANGRLTSALGIAASFGGFTNELFTTEEPFGWRLNFEKLPENDFAQMPFYAAVLLALVDNLGYVEWSYPGQDAAARLSAEGASEIIGRDIKAAAETVEALDDLLNELNLFDYNHEIYSALTNVSAEDFSANALVIRDGEAENIEKLNEFLNILSMDIPAALNIVNYTNDGPALIRVQTDGSRFWAGERDGYSSPNDEGEKVFSFGPYEHLKLMNAHGYATFFLTNDPALTIDEIFSHLLSSKYNPNPPEFKLLFSLNNSAYSVADAAY